MSKKQFEEMTLDELQEAQIQSLRLTSLYINLPVRYESNVALTDEMFEQYKKESKKPDNIMRMMVADNIKIEDIANSIVIFNTKFEIHQILGLMMGGNWIENKEDFSHIKSEVK